MPRITEYFAIWHGDVQQVPGALKVHSKGLMLSVELPVSQSLSNFLGVKTGKLLALAK